MTDILTVLAKAPLAGLSKTRLAEGLGRTAAARIARALVRDTLARARDEAPERVLVAFAPADEAGWFATEAPWARRVPQPDGDLGARMRAALDEAEAMDADRCVIIGTDAPHLPKGFADAAFRALDDADVCVGPAVDGGYYLLGVKAPWPALFEEMPWSQPSLFDETLARARDLGLTVATLQTETDLDDDADVDALRDALAERPGVAPETRAALAALGPVAAQPKRTL